MVDWVGEKGVLRRFVGVGAMLPCVLFDDFGDLFSLDYYIYDDRSAKNGGDGIERDDGDGG